MNQTERLGREMNFAKRYTILGEQRRKFQSMIASGVYPRRVREDYAAARDRITEEVNAIWKEMDDLADAIQFRVPDDGEGI